MEETCDRQSVGSRPGEALRSLLFGYDVFLSYARQDASSYAQALSRALIAEDLTCFLDRRDAPAGEPLEEVLRTALSKSQMLVVVVSKAALGSRYVSEEVSYFAERRPNRRIVFIDVDGALGESPWQGRHDIWVAVSVQQLEHNEVNDVTEAIRHARLFRRRKVLARRLVGAISALLAILAGAALLFGIGEQRQRQLAEERRKSAEVNALVSRSVLELKQEQNPTSAYELAQDALAIDPGSVSAWGTALDARYSQIMQWQGAYYSVPFARRDTLSGILGSADLSYDGRMLAYGSWDPPVAKLWDLGTDNVFYLTGFTEAIQQIRFCADGAFLVAAATGPSRVYEADGSVRCRLDLSGRLLTSADVSRDGRRAVAGFEDGSTQLWSMETGEPMARLRAVHGGRVEQIRFSPAGDRVLSCASDGTAVIWNLRGDLLNELPTSSTPLTCAAFSSHGDRFLTGAEGGEALVWHTGTQPLGLIKHGKRLSGATWSPDDSLIATCSRDGSIVLSDRNGNELRRWVAHEGSVRGVRFSSDSEHLLSFGDDGAVKIWNRRGEAILTLAEASGPIMAAGFSNDGSLVYASAWDSTVRIFEMTAHPVTTYGGLRTGLIRTNIVPGSDRILAVSNSGDAVLWEHGGRILQKINPNRGWLRDVVLSETGRLAFVIADRGGLLWNLERMTWKSIEDSHVVSAAKFFPAGETIVMGLADGRLKIINEDGLETVLGRSDALITALDVAASDSAVAIGLENGGCELWSYQGMRLWQHSFHGGEPINSVRFSPRGEQLVTASADNRALLWDLEGNVIGVFKHVNDVLSADFCNDGTHVLTYSADGTAKWWTRGTELLADFRSPAPVNQAVLSPNERYLVTGSNDGKIRIWNLDGTLLVTMPAAERRITGLALSTRGDWLVSGASDGRVHGWDLSPGPVPDRFR
jgi:WD40 repeat protein